MSAKWRRMCAGLLVGSMAVSAAPALAQSRVALVLGNGRYSAPQRALPNAINDAHDMAAALGRHGFKVIEVENADRAGMKAALGQFTAALKPGDVAVFYYAGHGIQAPAAANHAVNDDFLIPVDAKPSTLESFSRETLSLSEVLAAVSQVKTGAQVIILDACRDDPTGDIAHAAGLAWPESAGARNAFIVFAASPGEVAGDPKSGTHGVFTGEVLKRIDTPGLSAAVLFTEVANAVEKVSDPTQRPYFAGTGAGAAVVLSPGAKPVDPAPLELANYRQAVACGKAECLDFAMARVAEPRLKVELQKRKDALPAIQKPLDAPTPPAPIQAKPASAVAEVSRSTRTGPPAVPTGHPAPTRAPGAKRRPVQTASHQAARPAPTQTVAHPALPAGQPPEVQAFARANAGTAVGQYEIGRRFLYGSNGFPANWPLALTWLKAASANKSIPADMLLGSAYENGLGPKRDRIAARGYYLEAAILGSADGAAHAANQFENQARPDYATALKLYQAAIHDGSTFAMLALGSDYQYGSMGLTANQAEALRLFRLAIEKGDPDGYTDIGNCYSAGMCGFKQDNRQAVDWYVKAINAGSVHAASNLGRMYLNGQGVPKDLKLAFHWFKQAADKGDDRAMRYVADFYTQGIGGAPKDEAQGARLYRTAAESGEPFAAMELAKYYDRHRRDDPRNAAEARHWRDEAKALGYPSALFRLMATLGGAGK